MVRWIDALARTRRNLMTSVGRALSGPERLVDTESFEELEETLIAADVPVKLASRLIAELDAAYRGLNVSRREMLRKLLVSALPAGEPLSWVVDRKPMVTLIVGVNGSGKTTTCAKLARRAGREGRKPLLGATDTFRAAGAEQLKWWAENIGCPVVMGAPGADAAAVAYDAVDSAMARGLDVVFIDTAGRMHTKRPLMQELEKVRRALGKKLEGAPHETWVVLDATLGQNAVIQAKQFHEVTPLTGAVVAKLDGSSKAGFIFSVAEELGIPVRMAGLGEGPDDLVPFEPSAFVDALLGMESEAGVNR